APALEATKGVYKLREARGEADVTVVLQGSGVAIAFVQSALPQLLEDGIDVEAVYVSSPELFDRLDDTEKADIYGEGLAQRAMGITGFTLPTMYRWVASGLGRAHTQHPFIHGHFLGSGTGDVVIHEAGLDGPGQYAAIKAYIGARAGA
ncbi:MAG: hypothetical protein HOD00_00940, partial [Gemmatimonadales bacterium]|nr:hypothetical protein [Gemmatimonadales bacterium]